MIYRLILPSWAKEEKPKLPSVLEGEFTWDQIQDYNAEGYNVYFLPNYPSEYIAPIDGSMVDTFNWVFIDCDLKDKVYGSKEDFLRKITDANIPPTTIVDSGNGIHVYWQVSNLDAMSYLRFQRRLMRLFKTDEAVGQLFQLMRCINTMNTKTKDNFKKCELLYESDVKYNPDDLNRLLPTITLEDEAYCKQHFDRTHNIDQNYNISEILPIKFGKLLKSSKEIKELWAGSTDDRSMNDWRIAHIMCANEFSKEEAASVLVNSAKALQRSPVHRASYAMNIIDKIWTFEDSEDKDSLNLSRSVKDILLKNGSALKGVEFRCHPRIDNTYHGFRLGQVIGLVAGSGVGKTAFSLNMFHWFVENNPDYHHFFVPLEQPVNEIADRWSTMCGTNTKLHDKVHVISNYDDDGNFRHLSFEEIKNYIEKFKKINNISVGCIVIDHIGALKKKGKNGENQDIVDICHSMKAFAIQTNTLLVMQSQTSRGKAGIGDIELDKDAAYGTVYFESYCDYLISLWQPLKRCYDDPVCPTVTAFKFCKIRHKKTKRDVIKEDTAYYVYFDSETERMRDLTQTEKLSFEYFYGKAISKRKSDKKTDAITYQSVPYMNENKDELQENN